MYDIRIVSIVWSQYIYGPRVIIIKWDILLPSYQKQYPVKEKLIFQQHLDNVYFYQNYNKVIVMSVTKNLITYWGLILVNNSS